MRYTAIVLIVLALVAVIIGSIVMLKKDMSTNTETQSYLIPTGITSSQIKWDGEPLVDSTVMNGNTCTAIRNGMEIIVHPCVAEDVDGQDIQQYVSFKWNGANEQNVGWIFVYDGDLESGRIEANLKKTITMYREANAWVSNYLVQGIANYTDLGTPNELCEIGNSNNTMMYKVTTVNNTIKNYCFTSRTVVNSTAFRISGNYWTTEPYQTDAKIWTDVTSQINYLGSGLLNDSRSYYRVESTTFQPNQQIETKWTYTPQSKDRKGKWHILGYDADIGLAQSLAQNKYIYLDPWWSASWQKKKKIDLNFSQLNTTANVSVFINVTYDSDMNANFSDLRFVDAEEDEELSYWFFNDTYIASNSVRVFVKLNRNVSSAANTSIYMYYNNPAGNYSGSVRTAGLFGEDFNSVLTGGERWDTSVAWNYNITSIGTMYVRGHGDFRILDTNTTYSNYIAISRYKAGHTTGGTGMGLEGNPVKGTSVRNDWGWFDGTSGFEAQFGGTYSAGASLAGAKNITHILELRVPSVGNGGGSFWFNETYLKNASGRGSYIVNSVPDKVPNNLNPYVGYTMNTGWGEVDWLFIRRYVEDDKITATFGSEEVGLQLTATQDTLDLLNITDQTPDLKCNFSASGQNITSVKINVYDSSNNLDYTNTDTMGAGLMSVNKTWTTSTLGEDIYTWACYGFGSLGTNGSTANRTFEIHITAPSIVATNITSISSTTLPVSSNWYANISDPHIASCWYFTSDNVTNTTISCYTDAITRIQTNWSTYGLKYINIWGNDTFGNVANKSYSLSISNISIVANSPADSYKSANPLVTFNCTANYNPATASANISLYIDGVLNETVTDSCGGTCSYLQIQKTNTLSEGDHTWYCKADNNINGDTAVTTDRNIIIDYTVPVVVAYNITNISGESIPSSKWWVSINDTNRQVCWYHTSESPFTNTTFACATTSVSPITTNWGSYGSKQIKVYANDSIGNFNSATYYLTVSNISTTLTSPANQTWYNVSSVPLECTASVNPSANINLSLYVDDVLQETNVTSGTIIYESKDVSVADGNHTWYCVGADMDTHAQDISQTRRFYVDTTVPSTTITSPTGVIEYHKPNLLLTLNWTTSDANPTNCWYSYKGVNNSVTCGVNTTTINTTSYEERTAIFYANDSAGNVKGTVTTWDYYFWESGRFIPTNIYQTDIANYQLNGSSYNPTLLTATLWTGASSSSTTRSYAGSNVSFTSSSSVPATAGSGTVDVLWSFGAFNTTSTSQTTNAILFGICNATLNVPFLNITFYDESTNARINATIDASTFDYKVAAAGTEYKNFTYANSTVSNELDFCFAPASITAYVDVNFRYSNTGYQRRTWNENTVALTNSTTEKHLYLFSSTSGQYVNFHTTSGLGVPISDVLVTVSNQILGFTESRYSDDEGVTSFWLNPSDEYTVIATKSGYITKTRNVAPVDTDYDIVMQSEEEISNITNVCAGLNISFYPNETELSNDTVYDFGANIISSDITLASWGFYIRNASEYIVNQSSALGNGGSLTIESNTGQSPEVYLDVYVVYDGDTAVCARQYYYVSNDVGKEYSINHFITDLRRYLDNGSLFGLTNFGLRIIIFAVMLVTLGILVTYYGADNSAIIILGYGIFSFVAYYIFGAAVMPIGVPVLLILGSVTYMIWEWSR